MRNSMRFVVLVFLGMLSISWAYAEEATQTLKGIIVDDVGETPIFGARVQVLGTEKSIGAISDKHGTFHVKSCPLGRYDIRVSVIGYETQIIRSVVISSGKEAVLEVKLKEKVVRSKSISVTTNEDRLSMASLSSRALTIEEAGRFAGGLNDPMRLAASFAGVADGSVESNGVIVRGNAPSTVQYKIEGNEVYNPNHFAGEDLLGGGFVSILNSHVLEKADFLTGAFPAEYGNALGAVFDIKIRSGNTEKYEHAFEAGVLGLEVSSEGPISRENQSSYLINYRYSTFGAIEFIMSDQTGLPIYQDMSFKLRFPTQFGIFSLWGAGGLDSYSLGKEKKPSESQVYDQDDIIRDKYSTCILGLDHKLSLNDDMLIKSTFMFNTYRKDNDLRLQHTDLIYYPKERMISTTGHFLFSSVLNTKFAANHRNQTGITIKSYFYDFDNKATEVIPNPLVLISNTNGNTLLAEVYSQSKFDVLDNLELTVGLRGQYLGLNKELSIEPRIGFRWQTTEAVQLGLAYGLHSQMQSLPIYFAKSEESGNPYPNTSLRFMKAHHLVASLSVNLSENLRISIEPYFQYLFNVPVIPDSSFAIINLVDENTFNHSLVNKGTARNIGIDISLEKKLHDGYYYLISASIFDSKFKGGDGIERNTRFNKKFTANVVCGKEWKIGENNSLSANLRLYLNNGDRLSPVNNDKSLEEKQPVFDETRAFENKYPVTYRTDINLTYRINGKGISYLFSAQVLNVLSSIIQYEYQYAPSTNSINKVSIRDVLPSVSVKVEF